MEAVAKMRVQVYTGLFGTHNCGKARVGRCGVTAFGWQFLDRTTEARWLEAVLKYCDSAQAWRRQSLPVGSRCPEARSGDSTG